MKLVDLAKTVRPADACEFCVFPGRSNGIAVASCEHIGNLGRASGIPMAQAECCTREDWAGCPFNKEGK